MVSLKGTTAGGHLGWVTKKCIICNRKLVIGKDPVYYCPNCSKKFEAYFCQGDYKVLHERCPYCGTKLEPVV